MSDAELMAAIAARRGGGGAARSAPIPMAPAAQTRLNTDVANVDSQIESRGVGNVNTAANTERTAVETQLLRQKAAQFGLEPNQYLERKDAYAKLPFVKRQIENLEAQFTRNFQGRNPAEYLPGALRPANEVFDTTSGSLRSYVSNMLGLTSQQFNTPAEQQAFIGAMLPKASDTDGTIQNKLDTLNFLHGEAQRGAKKYGFAPNEDKPPRGVLAETSNPEADAGFRQARQFLMQDPSSVRRKQFDEAAKKFGWPSTAEQILSRKK
jgi:hypothetical protein